MERQFVVQLPNRPGELGHLARALAARGIDIVHISCAGTGPVAGAFLTTDDAEATRAVLRGLGYDFVEGEPIVVDVPDRPGGLAEVAERLGANGVNILGALTIGRQPGIAEMAFVVDDVERAREVLAATETAQT